MFNPSIYSFKGHICHIQYGRQLTYCNNGPSSSMRHQCMYVYAQKDLSLLSRWRQLWLYRKVCVVLPFQFIVEVNTQVCVLFHNPKVQILGVHQCSLRLFHSEVNQKFSSYLVLRLWAPPIVFTVAIDNYLSFSRPPWYCSPSGAPSALAVLAFSFGRASHLGDQLLTYL